MVATRPGRKGKTLGYCANCGTPLNPGVRFCNRCGRPTGFSGAASAAPAASPAYYPQPQAYQQVYSIQPGYVVPTPVPRPHPLVAGKQIVAAIGSILLAVGVFLPIVGVSGATVSYWDVRDYYHTPTILLVIAGASLVITILRWYWLLLAAGGLALGILGHDFVQLQQLLRTQDANSIQIQTQWGAVVLVAGGLALMISPFIPRKKF
jgi:zinc-ribbon domain